MRNTHTPLLHAVLVPLAGIAAFLPAASSLAQVFDGGGIQEGVNDAEGVTGLTEDDPRVAIVRVLATVLNFLGLLATAMIIIAGFYLVLSLGDDERKEKAKKIIYYTLIGLVVILFSRIIVSLITEVLASQVR